VSGEKQFSETVQNQNGKSSPATIRQVADGKVAHGFIVAFLVLSFFLLGLFSLKLNSVTVDEFAHLPAGYYYLKTGNFYLFNKNPPLIKLLMALPLIPLQAKVDGGAKIVRNGWHPWIFGYDFMEKNRGDYQRIFFWGRLINLCLGVVLGLLIYFWARETYGRWGGIIALFFWAFEPNLLAHAGLATVDVGCALGFAATIFCFMKFLRRPGLLTGSIAGVVLGLAQLTKFTALVLYPLLLLLALVHLFQIKKALSKNGLWLLVKIGAIFLVSVVVINIGYGFQDSCKRVSELDLRSQSMTDFLSHLPGGLRIPLPKPYLEGYDDVSQDSQNGEFPNYLMGQWSVRGWWYYFFLSMVFKMPLVLLLFLIAAPFAARFSRAAPGGPTSPLYPWEYCIWLPPAALLILFSLFVHLNYGIRYLLPIFPFLFIFTGRLAPFIQGLKKPFKIMVVVLLCSYPLCALGTFPGFLSYFNMLAGEKDKGHEYLLDSNLDWGQDLPALKKYMDKNHLDKIGLVYFGHVDPAIYGIEWDLPETRISPYVAISANFLHGYPYPIYRKGEMINFPPERYTWLLKEKPVAILNGSIFIYHIDPYPAQ